MTNTPKRTVAVVTGDSTERHSLVAALEKEGLSVVVLPDLAQALAALQGAPPDLVVADLAPPGLEGWRLCCALRSPAHPAWNRVPVLLVSASLAQEDSRRTTIQLGGSGLIPFPFEEEQFLARVRGLLAGEGLAGEGLAIDTTAFYRLEQRYQMLFTRMLDAFVLFEVIADGEGKPFDYRYLAVNPVFEQETGLLAQDVIGRTIREVRPGTEGAWLERYGNVVLTGRPLRFESCHAELNKHFDVYAFRPQEGQFACIFRDISELKARVAETEDMAEKMRRTADAYRAIFEGALEGIYRTSPDGHFLSLNPAMARMLGYDPEFLVTQTDSIPVQQVWADPEERERFLRLVEERGSVHGYECRFRHQDGRVIWVSLNSRKVIGPDGQTAYFEGFVEDITERKQAEEKLKTSENKFRMAFMTGADAFSIATLRDGRILDVNDRFADVFGYSEDEARGKTTTGLGLYADSDRRRLLAGLKANGYVRDMEFVTRRKNGELRTVLLSANLLQGGGEFLLLTAVRDVTDQKRAEAEKTKLEERLRQVQKLESIGRLAGGVAHDFNNLLTVINGYGDLLLRQYRSDDPLREWVEEICRAGERAVNLTRQLLVFSRQQFVEPRPVNLHDLVTENQSMLRRLIGEDIELVIEADPSLGTVMADPGQLHQVLMNLAVNARDAMPRGGKLIIRAANADVDEALAAEHPEAAPGRYVSFMISDTGAGIAKEIQERIFDPFFTTKAEGEGTGLGLSTVYGIVRQLGGWIAVRSDPGRGATFEIYLPRLQEAAAAGDPAAPSTVSARGSETVLVVEDQEPVRDLAVTVLKEHGYRVMSAANGEDALLLAARHLGPIHLLLTDVVMPHMTGKELAERLTQLRPESKVLYMSGYTADIIARRELLASEASFLAKPFAPHVLAVKVREVLGPPKPAATILVVDDEESVRGLFQRVLTDAGYEVFVASDGAKALKKIHERRFDLLVTDLVMPEQEGLDIIGIVHRAWPQLKIVAVSGAFGGTFLKAAQLLGAKSALLKPVAPEQLLAAVKAALS